MLSPIIKEPIFEFAQYVFVHSVESGATLTIFSGKEKIGISKALGGSLAVTLDRQLQRGEYIKAVSELAGQNSPSSVSVSVQELLLPLPAPVFMPTLYAGAKCIAIWGVIPGSKVKIISYSEQLGENIAITGEALIRLTRPLNTGDKVSLFSEIGGNQSASTDPITPEEPIGSGKYAEQIPPPNLVEPLVECQRIVEVEGLIPGSRFWVYADHNVVFDNCSGQSGLLALLGSPLKENQYLTTQQSFEMQNLKSDLSDFVSVGSAKILGAPSILEPIYEGERSITVLYLHPSVKVEIAIEGKAIGSADFAGESEFDLGCELVAGQKIKARQFLCNKWSFWSKEVTVEAVLQAPGPPQIKPPLYACGNHVPVENRVEGATVKIFAGNTLIGKEKLSWVRVKPHLFARQRITATQIVGKLESPDSQPETVKDIPELLPVPKWHQDEVWWAQSKPNVLAIDVCSSYLSATEVLPGAQVNIFWNNLLIGSAEAADSTAIIPVKVKLQPGIMLHLEQNLCTQKSIPSKKVTAFGMLAFPTGGISGSPFGDVAPYVFLSGNKGQIKVTLKCPAKADVKVTLSSTNEKIAAALGSNEVIIPKGKREAEFTVGTYEPGWVYFTAAADYYEFVHSSWDRHQASKLNIKVMGTISLNPDYREIEVGESFNLYFTLKPVPSNRAIFLYVSAPSKVNYPQKVTIPEGKDTGVAIITGVSPGLEWIEIKDPEANYTNAKNLKSSSPSCKVRVITSKEKIRPLPETKTKIYKQLLQWKAPAKGGNMYVMAQVYPIPNGKLKKIRNINTYYPWRYHLWFPKYPYTTDDAFDPNKGYLLKIGNEATPATLNLQESLTNGLLIGATPSPLDTKNQGPVYIELTYEV